MSALKELHSYVRRFMPQIAAAIEYKPEKDALILLAKACDARLSDFDSHEDAASVILAKFREDYHKSVNGQPVGRLSLEEQQAKDFSLEKYLWGKGGKNITNVIEKGKG